MESRYSVLILFLCLLAAPAFAQNPPPRQAPQPPSRGDMTPPPIPEDDDAQRHAASEMAKKAAKERVAALRTDTDKLLKLSVELKNYVDKSDENVLSLDVIKKADEIERLAKSVRDKMKGPN